MHPERYALVGQMAKDAGTTVPELMKDEAKRKQIDLRKYVTAGAAETGGVGLQPMRDLVAEMATPGRDPRQQFVAFQFAEGVHELKDLTPGMKLPGLVHYTSRLTADQQRHEVSVELDPLLKWEQVQ